MTLSGCVFKKKFKYQIPMIQQLEAAFRMQSKMQRQHMCNHAYSGELEVIGGDAYEVFLRIICNCTIIKYQKETFED